MPFAFKPLRTEDLEHLTADEELVLVGNARLLRDAGRQGPLPPLLRDKHFGLLSDEASNEEAELFRHVATLLGARVSRIRSSLIDASDPVMLRNTARMLGRLYDAIECQGVNQALARRIRADAGVPVFAGIASAFHPTARLAETLVGMQSADARPLALQTVLVSTVA